MSSSALDLCVRDRPTIQLSPFARQGCGDHDFAQEYEVIAKGYPALSGRREAGQRICHETGLHADATVFGYVGPDLVSGPIKVVYDWVDQPSVQHPISRHAL